MLANLVRWASGDRLPLSVEGPGLIDCHLYRQQDRLILHTIRALNDTYESPYERKLDFPIRQDMPSDELEALRALVESLKPTGVPDTVAYITEEELTQASKDLESIGYDPQAFLVALTAPPSPVDYCHCLIQPCRSD